MFGCQHFKFFGFKNVQSNLTFFNSSLNFMSIVLKFKNIKILQFSKF